MPEKIIAVYVCRHGETTLNAQNCFRGNANPPLNEKGTEEAHKLGHYFSNIEISAIFSSDRIRATSTAEIIGKSLKVPLHKVVHLRALNVGDFSGQKRTPESEAELMKYVDNPQRTIPGGESLADFKSRVRPCLMEAVKLFMECGVPPLIVAHSSVVHELGDMFWGDHKSILVHPGGVAAIYFEDGKLGAEAIYRPIKIPPGKRADSIS